MISEPRLNLACGQVRIPGYFGIDNVQTDAADALMDLEQFPWDIADNSAEEILCSHYIEHTSDLIKFMDEVYRILKLGGYIKIIAPYYTSIRCWQDPTHKRAISEATFDYFSRDWRERANLTHYPIKSNFEIHITFIDNPYVIYLKPPFDIAFYRRRHLWNIVDDIIATLIKL
jgi:predicted SAM-dependent methyltransferase